MSTPYEFERAPAAWSAAQVAAVREATAELRAARRLLQNPPLRRSQRFAHPLVGYAAFLACVLLFAPILTCGGLALPVLTCVGMSARHAKVGAPTASTQAADPELEAESASQTWYSYRGRDGVMVYAYGVPPFGSTVIGPDHHPNVAGPDAGTSNYTDLTPPSSSTLATPMRSWSRFRRR